MANMIIVTPYAQSQLLVSVETTLNNKLKQRDDISHHNLKPQPIHNIRR